VTGYGIPEIEADLALVAKWDAHGFGEPMIRAAQLRLAASVRDLLVHLAVQSAAIDQLRAVPYPEFEKDSAERDALAAVIDKVAEIAVKASATPRSNDPFCVGIDIADDLRAALAAGLAAPVGETPDEPRRNPERCNAIGHPTVTPESLIPCQLDKGHEGSHYSTSGCAGGAVDWPGPAVPVEEQQREDGCLRDEGHDGDCVDAVDVAEGKLRARDWDGWSGL
jgi:hypothetical protein